MDTFILLHIKPPRHGRGSSSSPPLYQGQCSLWKNTWNSPGPGLLEKGPEWRHWSGTSSLPLILNVLEKLFSLAVLMKQHVREPHHHPSQLAYSANYDTDGCLAQSTYYVWGTGHKDKHSLSQINTHCLISSWQSHEIDTETIPAW